MQQRKTGEFKEVEKFITIDGEQIDTTLLTPEGEPKGKILFLHGAGESTKERLLPLAREMARLAWSCLTFSLPGHGNSSGNLLGSTLVGRKQMTHKIAEHFDFWPADIVLGISMGAHTAISLLGDEPEAFKKLVLLVPAAYAREAEEVPFGPEFSEILRKPKSYHSARNWDILQKYHGQIAAVQAGEDQVIPVDVYDLIKQSSKNAEYQPVLVENSTHQISVWMNQDPARVSMFANAIDSFDFSGCR